QLLSRRGDREPADGDLPREGLPDTAPVTVRKWERFALSREALMEATDNSSLSSPRRAALKMTLFAIAALWLTACSASRRAPLALDRGPAFAAQRPIAPAPRGRPGAGAGARGNAVAGHGHGGGTDRASSGRTAASRPRDPAPRRGGHALSDGDFRGRQQPE